MDHGRVLRRVGFSEPSEDVPREGSDLPTNQERAMQFRFVDIMERIHRATVLARICEEEDQEVRARKLRAWAERERRILFSYMP